MTNDMYSTIFFPVPTPVPMWETGDIMLIEAYSQFSQQWVIVDEDHRLVNLHTGRRCAWDIISKDRGATVIQHHRGANLRLIGAQQTWRKEQ